jgi:hypothetical protein
MHHVTQRFEVRRTLSTFHKSYDGYAGFSEHRPAIPSCIWPAYSGLFLYARETRRAAKLLTSFEVDTVLR